MAARSEFAADRLAAAAAAAVGAFAGALAAVGRVGDEARPGAHRVERLAQVRDEAARVIPAPFLQERAADRRRPAEGQLVRERAVARAHGAGRADAAGLPVVPLLVREAPHDGLFELHGQIADPQLEATGGERLLLELDEALEVLEGGVRSTHDRRVLLPRALELAHLFVVVGGQLRRLFVGLLHCVRVPRRAGRRIGDRTTCCCWLLGSRWLGQRFNAALVDSV